MRLAENASRTLNCLRHVLLCNLRDIRARHIMLSRFIERFLISELDIANEIIDCTRVVMIVLKISRTTFKSRGRITKQMPRWLLLETIIFVFHFVLAQSSQIGKFSSGYNARLYPDLDSRQHVPCRNIMKSSCPRNSSVISITTNIIVIKTLRLRIYFISFIYICKNVYIIYIYKQYIHI